MRKRRVQSRSCFHVARGQQNPSEFQQMFWVDDGNIICLFIPLSQEEAPFGSNLLSGRKNELLTWLSLVGWRTCQPARGMACKGPLLTCVHTFLDTLVCVLFQVCMRLLFHAELGFFRRPGSAEQYCSAFCHQHLSEGSGESHLCSSAGIFIYLDAAGVCLPVCQLLWPSLRFSVLSTLV